MNINRCFHHAQKILLTVLVLSLLATGCAPASSTEAAVTEVQATETATASPVPSNTPLPTQTDTPVPTSTSTATVTATASSTPDRTATLSVKQTATQAAMDEKVGAELAKYNIDPSQGHVTWMESEAIELDGSGYSMGWYLPLDDVGMLKDFVVQSDITWKTSTGFAGCSYIFRAPDDWDLKIGDFYRFVFIRLQYAPVWFMYYYKDGLWQYTLPGQSGVTSKNLLDDNMSKNTITLDARGDTFTVYINGVKERAVQNNRISEGRLAFEVIQESGASYCKFENSWVWEYDQ